MAAEILVKLDQPFEYYTAGDMVSGHVSLISTDADRLEMLEVRHFWRACRPGWQPVEQLAKTLDVSDQHIEPDREHRFKFAFDAQRTPVTHRGHALNVSWLIGVDARLANGGRGSAEAEYIQLAGKRESHKKGKPLIAGESRLGRIGNALFRRICNSRVTMRPNKVWPGQTTICTAELIPKSNATLNGVKASLVWETTTVTGKKKSPKVTRDRKVIDTFEFPHSMRDIAPGQTLSFESLFTVPQAATPSIASKRNKVEWLVELEVDVDKWPDLKESYPLIVLPPADEA